MKDWFINAGEHRLRAGWRILLFVLLFLGLSFAGLSGTRAVLGSLPKTSPLIFVLLSVAATLAAYLARRILDKRSLLSLGLTAPDRAWKDLLFGFVLSGVMVGAIFSAMAWSGVIVDIRLNWGAASNSIGPAILLPLLLSTVLIGYWEELAFRGYLLQNMVDGLGLRVAVIASCLLYGALHAGNPNAGILSTLIIVVFGYLRIYGYLGTGLLWLSMGMHIGWNFFQGPVFGYAASGHAEKLTVLSHRASGPDWLTGGQFGPEASLIAVPVVLLALLAMRLWVRRFGGAKAAI
jgi:membrane protease YdiL (CAAX protease family)